MRVYLGKKNEDDRFAEQLLYEAIQEGERGKERVYLRWTYHIDPRGLEGSLIHNLDPLYNQRIEHNRLLDEYFQSDESLS